MISTAGRRALLDVAEQSIRHGLAHGRALEVYPENYAEELRAARATFVTLHRHGELRGCIGVLAAIRPLVTDVAENAFAAAFRDPRFPPLAPYELPGLDLHVSVLSPPQALDFTCEEELLKQIRPGVDGLILKDCGRRGTFLPSVWESLPTPRAFLQHLKMKAGFEPDYWSDTLCVDCYTTESFGGVIND